MDKITVKDLEVFANHGVYEQENFLGQKFVISAVLHTDTRMAGLTDNLENSINYGEVSHLIKKVVEENTWNLIEKIAEEVAHTILVTYSNLVKQVDITVKKPWAPINLPLDTVSVEISRSWHTAYIALGSNMGDKKAYLDEAVEKLKNHPYCKVVKVSDYITTEPYGGVEQDVFLNGALEIKTLLYPEELLALLNRIEAEAGRERTIHWGPRTLDLDILFYDDCIIDSPALTVPHIDMQNRGFVLIPMAQIAPYHRHPVLGCTVGQLLSRLDGSLS